jgi:hypothetical protein
MELIQIKNILRSSKSPIYDLSLIRNKVGISKYDDIVKWIYNNSYIRNKTFHIYFPKKLSSFKTIAALTKVDERKELAWVFSYLKLHITELSDFRELSIAYQKSLFNGEYSACNDILKAIEEKYGYSLWIIKNRISLKQLSEGLEEQKKYSYVIKEELGKYGIASFITHYISMRNESSLSINRFAQLFQNQLDNLKITPEFKAYLKYHVIPTSDITIDELIAILRYETAGSVIDLYESLIFVMQYLVVFSNNNLNSYVNKITVYLLNRIDDARLKSIYNELNGTCEYFYCNSNCVNLFNSTLSNNIDVLEIAKEMLAKSEYSFETIELLATYSSIYNVCLNLENSFHKSYYIKLLSILNKSNEAVEYATDLLRLSLNNGSCHWSADIVNFLNREMSPSNTLSAKQDALYSLLESPSLYFNKLISLPLPNINKYINKLSVTNFNSLSSEYYTAYVANDMDMLSRIGLSNEYETLTKLIMSYNAGDYDNSIVYAEDLSLFSSHYLSNTANRLIAYSYVNLSQLVKATELIVNVLLNNENLSYMMPLKELVSTLDSVNYKSMTSMVHLPILYNLYSKYVDNKYDSQKCYSYEDFLLSNNLNKPSELRAIIDKFDKNLILYYLQYVCVETTMDNSIAFSSSSEVLEERLAVCKLIIDISEQPDELLQAEIRDILRKLMVGKRIKEIEQSKIYVDIDGFKITVNKTLQESFNRYLSFKTLQIDSKQNEIMSKLQKIISDGDISGLSTLILPNNEMSDLFESIIISLRDEFVSSSEHGLDGYLSVRIRHGTLSGQLLSPLESFNLVTKKNILTGDFNNNDYWKSRLFGIQQETWNELNNLLVKFTSDYNEIVTKLRNDIIQVRKSSADKGIIDFTLTKIDSTFLTEFAGEDSSFSEFIDNIIDYFYKRLEANLDKTRKYINTILRNEINDTIDSLITRIESLSGNKELSDIVNAIKAAKTEIQQVLDRIAEWFRLTKFSSDEPCTLEDAIAICQESLKMSKIQFTTDINIEESTPPVYFKGQNLASLVDILYIVFENIVKHSGTQPFPKATINISYDNTLLNLYITNEIKSDVNIDNIRSKIGKIKTAIKDEKYKSSVKKEGGTGFHKIVKILRHDISSSSQLDFGLIEETAFFVEIKLPAKETQLENITR